MYLLPAIDLRSGKAVRLLRGDYDKMTVYSDDPVEVALSFKRAGAKYLHIVDLDGAKDGTASNFELIEAIIKESSLLVQVGGGIRDMETAQRYINAGAFRIILGTAAVTNLEFLQTALDRFGDKLAVGVDLRDGYVATHGWTQKSTLTCFEFCAKLEELGVKTLICTDISKDGAMRGIDADMYAELTRRFSLDIIASGGVTSMDDLVKLSKTSVRGAILGKSLYTGSIDLKRALEVVDN